jgi:transcriptional regulator with XRE-family HTH domain
MTLNFKLIGRRVKETRTSKLISQAELAEQINMSVPYISHIETATKQVSLKALVQIANVLGVTVDTILNGNQSNDPAEYHLELVYLIDDCNSAEKRFIYEIASAAKNILRNNGWLQ